MDEARDYAAKNDGFDGVVSLLKENNLRLDQVLLLADVFSQNHSKNRAAYLKYAEDFFRDTVKMGGTKVVACSTFGTADIDEAGILYAELCDLAQDYNLRLTLEFIGWGETIKDLRTAWTIVDKAQRKNGGILYDTFHHFFGGTSFKDLEEIPVNHIFAVHIVDANKMGLSTLEISRKHRVFPGNGSVPLPEILSLLNSKNYNCSMALEIFNEEYWKRPPADVAQEGFKAMQKLISAAGFA